MSNYMFKARLDSTGEIFDAIAMDDFYGHRQYGYRVDGTDYPEDAFSKLYTRLPFTAENPDPVQHDTRHLAPPAVPSHSQPRDAALDLAIVIWASLGKTDEVPGWLTFLIRNSRLAISAGRSQPQPEFPEPKPVPGVEQAEKVVRLIYQHAEEGNKLDDSIADGGLTVLDALVHEVLSAVPSHSQPDHGTSVHVEQIQRMVGEMMTGQTSKLNAILDRCKAILRDEPRILSHSSLDLLKQCHKTIIGLMSDLREATHSVEGKKPFFSTQSPYWDTVIELTENIEAMEGMNTPRHPTMRPIVKLRPMGEPGMPASGSGISIKQPRVTVHGDGDRQLGWFKPEDVIFVPATPGSAMPPVRLKTHCEKCRKPLACGIEPIGVCKCKKEGK